MHWRMTKTQSIIFLITLYLVSHINTFASEDKTRKDDKNDIARHNIIVSIKAGSGGGGRGGGGGGGGGRSGGGGTGSGSSSSRTPGGVIPVYGGAGAGAANNNNGHHNSGNRWQGSIGLVAAFSATILSSLFMFI